MTHSAGLATKTNRRPGGSPATEWVAPTMTEITDDQRPDDARIVTTTDPRDGRAVTYRPANPNARIAYDRDLLAEVQR